MFRLKVQTAGNLLVSGYSATPIKRDKIINKKLKMKKYTESVQSNSGFQENVVTAVAFGGESWFLCEWKLMAGNQLIS